MSFALALVVLGEAILSYPVTEFGVLSKSLKDPEATTPYKQLDCHLDVKL